MKSSILKTLGLTIGLTATSQAAVLFSTDFGLSTDASNAGLAAFNVGGGQTNGLGNGALQNSDDAFPADPMGPRDRKVNGGGFSTVRSGGNSSLFAAGSIANNGILTFDANLRTRDKENGIALVNAAGDIILGMGNTNGLGSLANGEDPEAFNIVNGSGVIQNFAEGSAGAVGGNFPDITGGSIYLGFRLRVDTSTGAATLQVQNLAGDANAVPDFNANTVTSSAFNIPAADLAALQTATGLFYGQSGGGTALDDVTVDFTETVVPEPSSALLIGLAGLGLLRRKRA